MLNSQNDFHALLELIHFDCVIREYCSEMTPEHWDHRYNIFSTRHGLLYMQMLRWATSENCISVSIRKKFSLNIVWSETIKRGENSILWWLQLQKKNNGNIAVAYLYVFDTFKSIG